MQPVGPRRDVQPRRRGCAPRTRARPWTRPRSASAGGRPGNIESPPRHAACPSNRTTRLAPSSTLRTPTRRAPWRSPGSSPPTSATPGNRCSSRTPSPTGSWGEPLGRHPAPYPRHFRCGRAWLPARGGLRDHSPLLKWGPATRSARRRHDGSSSAKRSAPRYRSRVDLLDRHPGRASTWPSKLTVQPPASPPAARLADMV